MAISSVAGTETVSVPSGAQPIIPLDLREKPRRPVNSNVGAIGTAMNEIDVLKKISSNLTERKNSAALSNYRVLCSNIAFLNEAFSDAISTLRLMHGEIQIIGDTNNRGQTTVYGNESKGLFGG